MWAESEGVAGKGSAFHFTIRAEVAPEIETRPHLAGEQAALRGKWVLIVDDNGTNRRILCLQTRELGHAATRDRVSAGSAGVDRAG